MPDLTEIRVAGFGGQGVILAAMIIGKAASIFEDGYATLTQNFGPEARGSACSAQVILSNDPVLYPYITRPDLLIAMSQDAFNKFVPELKDGGLLLVEEDLVRVGNLRAGVRVYSVPATRLAEQLGKRLVLNIVMVGFFAAVSGLLDPEALRKAVADSVPASFRDLNLKAFDKGYEYGLTQAPVSPEESTSPVGIEAE
ncbi:MAG: 2-oxoacid:acceptor oxidoreductase family protein [Bryobacteraceae bacterium]|nr:2-oxoacid:acceptor oxidoreductase family protein [Bryobacterales bacterium]MEB2361645.1 2-oxoacid:acceptor oxidoreductase family protein [Bryobacterales bacterium]NUN00658.1 2-oxoacid:acceptor oxidoreductase family protein [Bryobacteraceae bacterium]